MKYLISIILIISMLAACSTDNQPDEYEITYKLSGVTGSISMDLLRPDGELDSYEDLRASWTFEEGYTFPADERAVGAVITHHEPRGTAILDVLVDGTRRGRIVARAESLVTAQAWVLQDGRLEELHDTPFPE